MTIPIFWPFPCSPISETDYPDSDVSTGSWTPTAVYAQIDDTSDADSVLTPLAGTSPTTYTFECTLANPTGNPAGAACQGLALIARVRKVAVGTGTVDLTVRLREGASTTIASTTSLDIGTSYVDYTITLTKAQYASIGNHDDLRIQVAATIMADSGTDEIQAECSQARLVYS